MPVTKRSLKTSLKHKVPQQIQNVKKVKQNEIAFKTSCDWRVIMSNVEVAVLGKEASKEGLV